MDIRYSDSVVDFSPVLGVDLSTAGTLRSEAELTACGEPTAFGNDHEPLPGSDLTDGVYLHDLADGRSTSARSSLILLLRPI